MVAPIACDPSAIPAELPLKRLTAQQYQNSMRDLVRASGLADADAVLAVVAPDLSRYPADRLVGAPTDKHGGFYRLDQAIQQTHIDVSYDVAVGVAAEMVSTPARRTALIGACATDANTQNDAACLRTFVGRFGALAERRPLTAADLDFYVAAAGATPVDPGALADVITLLLTSPRFLYLMEEGDTAAPAPTALDAYALAARLSYLFWQTMPDQALFDAAASGALLTEAGYTAQIDRLFADPRTDASIEAFFSEWFRLPELTPLNALVGTPIYDAFAGQNAPSATLHLEMTQEIRDLVRWVARHGGAVKDVVTSRQVFATTDGLAALYEEPKWDGHSEPQTFSNPARAGLITRAALVASGSAASRPVVKGLRIRNGLLCQPIPPPPANVMAVPIEVRPDMTTREAVETITEQPGTACRGCHRTTLNPLGYATEDFDALGRYRTMQRLFGTDGAVVAEKPIDTRGVPNVAGVTTEIAGAGELTDLLVKGELQTCFARQYFRFSFQRPEDTADGCVLRQLQDAALADQPLSAVLTAIAKAPAFKQRDFR